MALKDIQILTVEAVRKHLSPLVASYPAGIVNAAIADTLAIVKQNAGKPEPK